MILCREQQAIMPHKWQGHTRIQAGLHSNAVLSFRFAVHLKLASSITQQRSVPKQRNRRFSILIGVPPFVDVLCLLDGPLPVLVLLLQGSGPCVHAENSLSPCTLQLPKGLAYVVIQQKSSNSSMHDKSLQQPAPVAVQPVQPAQAEGLTCVQRGSYPQKRWRDSETWWARKGAASARCSSTNMASSVAFALRRDATAAAFTRAGAAAGKAAGTTAGAGGASANMFSAMREAAAKRLCAIALRSSRLHAVEGKQSVAILSTHHSLKGCSRRHAI
jgi:hypothetical protein